MSSMTPMDTSPEERLKLMPKRTLKVLASGESGTGKTYFALTFPKVGYIGTEPNGLDILATEPGLAKNLVIAKEFLPSPIRPSKQVFADLDTYITELYQLYQRAEVETLVLDNMTYLSENRWLYQTENEKLFGKSGNLDTQSMYGNLRSWLYTFTLTKLCAFPGNVVATCHEQKDDEDDLEKVVDPTAPITPAILGGFRYKVAGMFSASIYLEKKSVGPGKYKYQARCQRGGQRNAKNRYGLPEIVENVSYARIVEELNKVAGATVTGEASNV